MKTRRRLVVVGVASTLALAALAAGCGGDKSAGRPDAPAPAARRQDFPKPQGKTLVQLLKEAGGQGGPVLSMSVSDLEPGRNRVGFGLFDRTRRQIAQAPTALYVAPVGGGRAMGPYPARYESLKLPPQFESRSVASDPDSARTVYVSSVKFPRTGQYDVIALIRLDNRFVAALPTRGLDVSKDSSVPEVGERAPVIHTPTVDSVGGDVKKIDTRVPPSSMHEVDFADVVGKKPVVLIFATPALCQSKVCGPVVDIAEQVKAQRGKDADFIHMEIYRDNTIKPGCLEGTRPQTECLRPQVLAYHLETEPWAFAIDRHGRIAARLEGAYSKTELDAALKAAVNG
jgi:hypothetical protein